MFRKPVFAVHNKMHDCCTELWLNLSLRFKKNQVFATGVFLINGPYQLLIRRHQDNYFPVAHKVLQLNIKLKMILFFIDRTIQQDRDFFSGRFLQVRNFLPGNLKLFLPANPGPIIFVSPAST